jgi:diaminohydroxyphosphoribosylaminopyrimidine deaminase / 5-amino-6-(5-phosphoribosylamino)uracil reductase
MEHEKYILRAIELADNGAGFVSPNPKVGAVIVRNNQIISEGWHTKFGAPHAEVEAIINAGLDDFTDCTIYVNLEPCSHFGKTPPCADLIIEKKFSRVVIGSTDPNPLVAGSGIAKLREANIEVITDVCKEESEWCNRKFFKYIQSGNPYIMLKIAQSLDGCIALKNGESKWITCEESRRRTHRLRSEYDAVLIGKTTALNDNPQLTVRSVQGNNPLRVVCDTNLSLPLDLDIFKVNQFTKTVVCCNSEALKSKEADELKRMGVNILAVKTDENGRLKVKEIIKSLKDKFNLSSLMVEGGGGMYSSFIKSGLVDEIQLFMAPKIFGSGLNPFHLININKVSESYEYVLKSVEISGSDIHAVLVRK